MRTDEISFRRLCAIRSHLPLRTLAIMMTGLIAFIICTPQVSAKGSTPEQKWSVQIEKIDPGKVGLEPAFTAAIYENLLTELLKTKRFDHVLRSGDRNADSVPELLILKTFAEKYVPGSETRRAVTTISGATKLNVRIQLTTRDGIVLLETRIGGSVRFIGNNLRASHNLAHNVAKALKNSDLPVPSPFSSVQ